MGIGMIESDDRRKLVMIGLDGATWSVIDPMVQRGELPNLARLIRQGTRGPIRSLEPMISTMLWTTISSGKLPDQHGVRDFAVSSRAVRCKRLWDICAQEGLRVGVYGHLITWPPDPIDGFNVPGAFALGPETHPPEYAFLRRLAMDEASGLKRKHSQYLGYAWKASRRGVSVKTLWQMGQLLAKETFGSVDPLIDYYQKRALKFRLDDDVFSHLCRRYRPHFALFYTHLIDSTQHLFWKYLQPEEFSNVPPEEIDRYGPVIPEAYREADRSVGRIVSQAGQEATFVIISDHGAQAIENTEENSAWTIKTEQLLKMMDLWERVRAVNIGFNLYLSPRQDTAEAKSELAERFQAIVTRDSGVPVFRVKPLEYSYLKIDVRQEQVDSLQGSTIKVGDRACPFDEIVRISTGRVSGAHHPDGICILSGRNIRTGAELGKAGLLDVTPTVLALLDLEVGRDMAGRVLEEAISEEFLSRHPIRYRETYESDGRTPEEDNGVSMPEDLVKKLKTLGYLG
jgi:predicted AlkP superfamily phosphohydrolase/phosphomutase